MLKYPQTTPLCGAAYAPNLRRAIQGRTGGRLPMARRINFRSGPVAWHEHQRSAPLAQGMDTGL